MHPARHRWTQRGWRFLLILSALSLAWYIRSTNGAVLLEIYAPLARFLEGKETVTDESLLADRRVRELQNRLSELEYQNRRLSEFLGYYRGREQPVIPAPIVGRSADNWWREVVIGRGSEDGIEVGSAVTGIGGVIGRITAVTPRTSRVMLIANANSRVGATISRSRAMGLIQGRDSRIGIMRFFEKAPNVKVGDVVTTSTVSNLFPAGLPVGRVISVSLEQNPVPTAKIEFTATVEDLEWVAVHPPTGS